MSIPRFGDSRYEDDPVIAEAMGLRSPAMSHDWIPRAQATVEQEKWPEDPRAERFKARRRVRHMRHGGFAAILAALAALTLMSCNRLPSSVDVVCHSSKPDTLSVAGFLVTSPDTGQVCGPK